jgi:flagellar biosynthesis protein FlhG
MSAPLSHRFGHTWYAVLDVNVDATAAQIERAAAVARRLLGSDALGAYFALDPASTVIAQAEVEQAALVLLDPVARASYDLSLGIVANRELGRSKTPVRILTPVDDHPKSVRFSAPEDDKPRAPLTAQPSLLPHAVMPSPSPALPPPPPMIRATPTIVPIEITGEVNGSVLRRVREARQLSLDDLAEQTKIRKTHLIALEGQDFVALPDRVYLRGFLTQIARVLRVDRVALAEGYLEFMARYGGRKT